MIIKAHKYSVIITYLLVFTLAIQFVYYNFADFETSVRLFLAVLGLTLFYRFKKISFWFNVILFFYWGIGLLFLFEQQMNGDGILYQYNWIGGLLFIVLVTALLTAMHPKIRIQYLR